MNPGRSEVAQLLEQIELEYQAAQHGLSGLSGGTSRHDFIRHKMENMHEYHQALSQLVGQDEATKLVATRLGQMG